MDILFRLYLEYYTGGSKWISPVLAMGKEYFEPIVFQQGKEAILEGLGKVQKAIKNDPNDSRESFRDIFRREVVLEGYYNYKTEKEFVTFVQDSFDNFCRDATYRDFTGFDGYLETVLPLFVATHDRDLVRRYVFTIKPHNEHSSRCIGRRHKLLINNYHLIKDFVDFSEIWDNDIIESLTGGLKGCMRLYKNLKNFIPENQLNEIILKAAGKNLDILMVGVEFSSLTSEDGIDSPYYHWLQELWGDKTDEIIGSRYSYIIKARDLYRSKYKVVIE